MSKRLEIGPGDSPKVPLERKEEEGWVWVDVCPRPGVDHVVDARALPFEDASFDEIYTCHVIEHFHYHEIEKVLKEWVRVLAPGGTITLRCPNLESLSGIDFSDWGWQECLLIQAELYGLPGSGPAMHHGLSVSARALKELLLEAGADWVFDRSTKGECYVIGKKSNGLTRPDSTLNPDTLGGSAPRIWLCAEHANWREKGAMPVVTEGLAKGLREEGAEVFVSYGEEDPRPEDPSQYVQVGMSGGTAPWVPWDVVGRYVGYSIAFGLQFPHSKHESWTRSMNSAGTMLFLNEDALEWARREGVASDLYVLRHGVDPEQYPVLGAGRADTFTFLVNGLTPRQGGWLIAEAFQKAFPRNPDVRLVMHEYANMREAQVLEDRFASDPRISISRGWVEHTTLLAEADCVVSASLLEGQDLSIIESMCAGRPVILPPQSFYLNWVPRDLAYWNLLSTGTVSMRELSGGEWDSGSILYVPCVNTLAKQMKHVFENPEEARGRGLQAAQWVRDHLTWRHVARRLLEILGLQVQQVDAS